ncbi:MAG TPA: histidinol-phosphate transaminase [Armatimonadota bacterium]|nr:histidinol-phosphate transaminase [Armatimonadota bacterium]HOS43218.1 histidinol-phosphate transaminase [Armatimonadota bacterium]
MARLGLDPAAVTDFSANQSPLGPAPGVADAIAHAAIDRYPDRDAAPLAAAIARRHALSPAQAVVGNGSTELIRLIAQLALQPGDAALMLSPTFGEYAVATRMSGGVPAECAAEELPQRLAEVSPRLCWLCSPNNPTGVALAPADIATLTARHRRTLFVLDEAYCDLLAAPQWTPDLLARGNLLILRSMTKAWGLAGLRLGYALGDAALMRPLRAGGAPWNVNACAQAAGLAALHDADHYARTVAVLREQKAALIAGLRALGWDVLPSDAAFFLVRVGDAPGVARALLRHGCLVRDCTSFGLPAHIRISPRRPEENRRLLAAFAALPPAGGSG